MQKPDVHFRLRLPVALKEWVEKRANENNRSINAEIIFCLQQAKDGVVITRDALERELAPLVEHAVSERLAPVEVSIAKLEAALRAAEQKLRNK